MDARAILRKKRDGGALAADEIEAFMQGYVSGRIPDYVASALLMAIFQFGMEPEELYLWTRAMLESGTRLEPGAGHVVDKHSTGGVGDKVSLPLAPALAACGARVPMVSGRGLGHTAGTLDKLEAIEGFSTALTLDEIQAALDDVGLAFAAQTRELVPADRKLYALRDATGLVESIPLIASSILSKKLAEGLDALVLDVKFGSGAFLPEPERGAELARAMLSVAERFGLRASAYQTSMEAPLGFAVGHALEVEESLACLRGEGPEDLRELVLVLGAELLVSVGLAQDVRTGREAIAASLDDGRALERFATVVERQGGDPRAVLEPGRLPRAPDVLEWRAEAGGTLGFTDCRAVGLALCELGGGRAAPEDTLDPAVGVVWRARPGDALREGDVLAHVHHRGGRGLEAALARLASAITYEPATERAPLVLARLEVPSSRRTSSARPAPSPEKPGSP